MTSAESPAARTYSWDVFISHASEDKESVAQPLADRLSAAGLRVWIDTRELALGQSLGEGIDQALTQSRWGLVILSRRFLEKTWTRNELDAFLALESRDKRALLPVWHGVTADEVAEKSPLLLSRIAANTQDGLDAVVEAVLRAVRDAPAHSARERGFLDGWVAAHNPANPRFGALQYLDRVGDVGGVTIGGYSLRGVLGEGGSGVVFHATHRALGTSVALKLLYPVPDSERLMDSTRRAVRGLAALRHPDIVEVLDFGREVHAGRAVFFVVTEFVRGVPLFEWISRTSGDARLHQVRERLQIAVQLAEALHAAHEVAYVGIDGFAQVGVLHGDLKPANVMIRQGTTSPVLLDFMLPDLQRLVAPESGVELSAGGVTRKFGTPGFMPPEQDRDGTVTPASDVFALGRTFRDLFWPAPPLISSADWARAEVEILDLEAPLKELVGEMTHEEEACRPATASLVATRLTSLREHHGV